MMDNRQKTHESAYKVASKIWISSHLRRILCDSGLTVAELSKLCGVSILNLTRIMDGKFIPPVDLFLRILLATGTYFKIEHLDELPKDLQFSYHVQRTTIEAKKYSNRSSITIKFD